MPLNIQNNNQTNFYLIFKYSNQTVYKKVHRNMFHHYLAHLLINIQIMPYCQVGFILIQAIQLLLILVRFQNINILKKLFLLTIIDKKALQGFFLLLQIILVALFFVGFYLFKKQAKRVMKNKQFNLFLVTKIFIYGIEMFKHVLIIPINYCIISSFQSHNDAIQLSLAVIILFIYFTFIVPISFFGFWNKFAVKQSSITYPYVINIASLIYICSHFFAYSLLSQNLIPYLKGLCFIIACPIIYFNSPFSYKKNTIIFFLQSFIISLFLISLGNQILGQDIDTYGKCIIFILTTFFVSYSLYHLQQRCIKQIFFQKIKKQKGWFNFIQNYSQLFMYHMLNYSEYSQSIIIYLLQHQVGCLNVQCGGKQIFNRLKQGQTAEQLFSQIKQFFIEEIQFQYHPKNFTCLGQGQIEKVIHQKGKLYLLIVQLTLMKDIKGLTKSNIRKSYCFLKEHQQLIKKTPLEYGFLSKIQISALLQVVEQQLIHQVKTQSLTGNFNSKAFQYFEYQQKLQNFKQQICQVCNLNLQFWNQLMYKEPDHKKIKLLVSNSQQFAHKVQKTLKKLLKKYKRSCLVTYELIFQYSKFVLNCGIKSSFNPFLSLQTKYKDQLQIYIKQNFDSHKLYYQETSTTPVCIISIDKVDKGYIDWQNSSFQKQYGSDCKMNFIKNTQNKYHINNLIPTFLQQTHDQFLDKFGKEQRLDFAHNRVFLLRKQNKQNYIESCSLEIQIFPSTKFGLKLIIYFKNLTVDKKQQIKVFIIDQHLQNTIFTKNLLTQWQILMNAEQYTVSPLQRFFKNNQNWKDILETDNYNAQIKLDMEDSDYKAKLTKSIANLKGNRYFYFQVKNLLFTPQHEERRFGESLKADSQTKDCIQAFMSTTAQSFKPLTKKNTEVDEQKFDEVKGRTGTQHLTTQMKKIYEQKTEQEMTLQKIFHTMSKPSTPKKIIIWRVVTAILLIFIVCGMILNMVITMKRKQVYDDDVNTITNYNQLISYLSRVSITLKQYNYRAYRDLTHPSLAFYKNQLFIYQQKISTLMYSLHDQLSDKWTAFQFQQSGSMKIKQQIQYVVIANYILSSVTFLSGQPYDAFNFPFLQSQWAWYLGMTKAGQNYQNVYYNTVYVALTNMLNRRMVLTHNIQSQIVDIDRQLYVFPTVGGSFILFLFILFSLIIENKSLKLIKQASDLLQQVSIKSKRDKISKIQQFKAIYIQNHSNHHSNNKFLFSPKSSKHNKTQKDTLNQKINQTDYFSQNDQQGPAQNIQTTSVTVQGQQKNESGSNVTESLGHNTQSNQTQRDLKQKDQMFDRKNQQSAGNLKFMSNTGKNMQTQSKMRKYLTSKDNIDEYKIKIDLRSNKNITFLFYIALVIPFFAYFWGIFFGGLNLNNKIMFYTEFASQLYHFSTFQQYNYLITYSAFSYQRQFTKVYSVTQFGLILIPYMMGIYKSSHYIEEKFPLVDQNSKFAQFKNQIDSGNLCNLVDLFSNQSIYYNITFTKTECQSIANKIMTKGYKTAFVYLTQTGIELINRNMRPQLLTLQQRMAYLEGPQLWNMKRVLAYSEQFNKIQNDVFLSNIQNLIKNSIEIINIISIVMILSLLLIVKAINYRWQKMRNEAKHVQSILRLISYKDIKEQKKLKQKFLAIDYKFYE